LSSNANKDYQSAAAFKLEKSTSKKTNACYSSKGISHLEIGMGVSTRSVGEKAYEQLKTPNFFSWTPMELNDNIQTHDKHKLYNCYHHSMSRLHIVFLLTALKWASETAVHVCTAA
jgi:hypothetical protein